MSKFSVKKPFTVLVGVIMILVLGYVSFTKMTTDLLPEITLPYMIVISTYPGATPEKVESEIVEVLESALGTVNGVENVTSTSSENYGMVMLEFEEDTNMDSAMVKVSSAVNQLKLPETAGTPVIYEISPDMMATLEVSVDYEGKDIYELSQFAKDQLIPYLERQDGVARVESNGIVEKTVEIRLDQKKVDQLNLKLKNKVERKMDEAQEKLDKAEKELKDAKKELKQKQQELKDQQAETSDQLGDASLQMSEAISIKNAYNAQLQGLQASQLALETEKNAYEEAGVVDGYNGINTAFSTIGETLRSKDTYQAIYQPIYDTIRLEAVKTAVSGAGLTVEVTEDNVEAILSMLGDDVSGQINSAAAEQADILTKQQIEEQLNKVPTDIQDAIANPSKLKYVKKMLKEQGQEEMGENLTLKNLKQMDEIVNTRIPQIETELANLKTEILAAQAISDQVTSMTGAATENYGALESGKISAAAGFGSGDAQIASGLSTIESSEKQLEESQDTLEESRENALEQANLNTLLDMDTLSKLISAQNFEMPAGYIYEGETQYMLKIGEEYDSVKDIEEMLLCRVDGIGDVRISDVAYVTWIDNADESYAKVNGNDAIILNISKSSTAGTSDVSKATNKAMDELEKEYPGLHFTSLLDQGDYIKLIVDSVLSNLIYGAILAIIVLILFLQDVRPTIVVAFSIPLSVLFAIVLMYFSDITLNIISLSGLALGVGMLVDNSIVVIENIYRMRSEGIPAPRAAVQGAEQVAGAIFSSTLTTICVFLPIVFTGGLTRELFVDMALTIAYSLSASLIVALTLVPAMSSTVLRQNKEKKHRFFQSVLTAYEKILRFFLRFKFVPILLSIGLLAFCLYRVTKIGMILLPDMGGNQMSVTVEAEKGADDQEAYALADQVLEQFLQIDGVETVGAISGGVASLSLSNDSTGNFTFLVLLDDEASKDNSIIAQKMEDILSTLPCDDYNVSTSNMDMSALMGSGMQIDISGPDSDTLLNVSQDIMDLLGQVKGFENITNGQEESDTQLQLVINKDKAMRRNLTVAQIFAELSANLTTETDSTTLTIDGENYKVILVDESDELTKTNLMDYEFTTTTKDDEGKDVEKKHKLSEFAEIEEKEGLKSISRENQTRYISVTAETMEGYNTTLLSREVEDLLDKYHAPDGYEVKISGESTSVNETMVDLLKMIGLAIVFIYLIMVAQFQNLLSPFIVLFTIPLAFTGGFLSLMASGEELSITAMMGFLVLSGVVVNNGIVFVDYTNQLRLEGMEKRDALVETGKTRMRPIFMTALTTILAMSTMALSTDAAATMGRGMAIVTMGGLAYATLMTLFIIPVLYDVVFRKGMKKIEVD